MASRDSIDQRRAMGPEANRLSSRPSLRLCCRHSCRVASRQRSPRFWPMWLAVWTLSALVLPERTLADDKLPHAGEVTTALSATGSATTVRFAVVIGNNRADSANTMPLRYADDDAVATHALLSQAGVRSRLLVRLDEDSSALHDQVLVDGPPTWSHLAQALAAINQEMEQVRKWGGRSEFFFFYSGHGDVANGEGYILLDDRRLTRSLLYGSVLAPSRADGNHVIIDACKSYFMVHERGPGGRRTPYRGGFAQRPAAIELRNTGFVVSTTSDGDSHEWERYQAGIFSHELRSALRGAADIDHDGRITYAELGAFLRAANQGIVNARYRPDFTVSPPGPPPGDLAQEVLSWAPSAKSLLIDRHGAGHIYVETGRGERLADAHAAPQHEIALYLPPERPLFVRANDNRIEFILEERELTRLSALQARPPAIGIRGALHLAFQALFSRPFGPHSLAQFREQHRRQHQDATAAAVDLVWPPQPKEAPSSESPLSPSDEPQPVHTLGRVRSAARWTGIVAGAQTAILLGWAGQRYLSGRNDSQSRRVNHNRTIHRLRTAALISAGITVAASGTWLVLRAIPNGSGDGDGRADGHGVRGGPHAGLGGGVELLLGGRW